MVHDLDNYLRKVDVGNSIDQTSHLMSTNEELSRFDFLWFKIRFYKDDPKWYRVLLVILGLTATVLIIWFAREWAISGAVAEKIANTNFSTIKTLIKSKFF